MLAQIPSRGHVKVFTLITVLVAWMLALRGVIEASAEDVLHRCSFMDSLPFADSMDVPPRLRSQQIVFLSWFARFMNQQASVNLKKFVTDKKVYDSSLIVSRLQARYHRTRPLFVELVDDGAENDDHTIGLAEMFQDSGLASSAADSMLSALESTMNEPRISAEHWETSCRSEWWPPADSMCQDIRCMACAPAVISASMVCKASAGDSNKNRVSYGCIQRIMGEGFCNFCVAQFIEM